MSQRKVNPFPQKYFTTDRLRLKFLQTSRKSIVKSNGRHILQLGHHRLENTPDSVIALFQQTWQPRKQGL